MKQQINQVSAFMKVTGQETFDTPTIPSFGIQTLRWGLIIEEANELQAASAEGDIVEVADGLCDLLYVVFGACRAYGFTPELMEELFNEVQASNMSKICRTPKEAQESAAYYSLQQNIEVKIVPVDSLFAVLRVSDGKVLKSINWKEPDLKSILERYGIDVDA